MALEGLEASLGPNCCMLTFSQATSFSFGIFGRRAASGGARIPPLRFLCVRL